MNLKVLVVCGSKSDLKVVENAEKILSNHNISYKVEVVSAHREPDRVRTLVKESDASIFIAVAGLSAALPGFIASLTDKPVIGVPVSSKLGGLDSLLSIAQMPRGVPVATVGIDNAENAAHLAIRIIKITGVNYETVEKR